MVKIATNRAHQIDGLQWRLTWTGFQRTDTYSLVAGGQETRVTPTIQSDAAQKFMKNVDEGLIIDLGHVDSEQTNLDFIVKVISQGPRSWRLESLNSSDLWESDAIVIDEDVPTIILTFEKQDSTWSVAARDRAVGSTTEFVVDSTVPEKYRELVSLANTRKFSESADNFLCLVDVTASMRQHLNGEGFPRLLTSLVAAAACHNRPIDVSYHGVSSTSLTIDDSIDQLHSSALTKCIETIEKAKPLHTVLENLATQLKKNSKIFVVTDGFVYLSSQFADDCAANDIHVQFLFLGSRDDADEFPGVDESDYLTVTHLGDPSGRTEKELIELM